MFRKILKTLLFSDFSRSELKTIKPQIMEENRKFCIIWSVIYVLFWCYCMIMTLRDPLYLKCRSIYIVSFAVSAAALLLAAFAAHRHDRLIRIIVIVLDFVLLFSGLFIARNLAPQTIVIFAAVLIVPVLFITDTLSTILILLVNIFAFILIGSRSMDPDIYRWVLSNLVIFSVIGLMLGHFVNRARFERYIFADSSAKLAAIQARNARFDQLTDLQNRRAYAEVIDRFSKDLPADFGVVIADINGLKQMNDTKGHNAGDELITGAAECLRKSFSNTDQIYRIGGDEFCVIITDPACDVEGALNRLQELSTNWKGQLIDGIAISAGFASAREFPEMDEIVKAADKRMYESKRKYYESAGNDRRRR